MSKASNLYIEANLATKSQAIELAFNKFKETIGKLKKLHIGDKVILRLTLDNLLNEIKTATRVIREVKK